MHQFARVVLFAAAGLAMAGASRAQEPFQPTEQHRHLAKEVGAWDAEVKLFLGPDSPPQISKGTQEAELLPGGLWLASKFEGTIAGRPFTGRGLSGYDPAKKKFVDVWVDSTDPHVTLLEGEYDAATKTVTSLGKSTDPRTGRPYDVKTTTVLKGDDERVFSFYMKNDETGGEYYKLMEMTYTRRGK
ncbi:DUF1579 domain-containing protein [Paludisphaera sp.]|uniref:DUF1579 domain-containing protein n=1 Tax=Paludisphaera sp. TaxID=2017432 RepID=UPI00301DF976